MTYRLPAHIKTLPHRERIMAKRALVDKFRRTQRPFGLIEFFDSDMRRRFRLPHQGKRERTRRCVRDRSSRPG